MIASKYLSLVCACLFLLSSDMDLFGAKMNVNSLPWNLNSVKPMDCNWVINWETHEYCMSVWLNVSRFPCSTQLDPNRAQTCELQQKILQGKLCCFEDDSSELKLNYQDMDGGSIRGVINKSDFPKIKNDLKQICEYGIKDVAVPEESSWSSWKVTSFSVFPLKWFCDDKLSDNFYLYGFAILTRTVKWNDKIIGPGIECIEEESNWICTQSSGNRPMKLVRNVNHGSNAGFTFRVFMLNSYTKNSDFWPHHITWNVNKEEYLKLASITNNPETVQLWKDEAHLSWTPWNLINPKVDDCEFRTRFGKRCLSVWCDLSRTISSTLEISLSESTCFHQSPVWVCEQKFNLKVPNLLCFVSTKASWEYNNEIKHIKYNYKIIIQKIAEQCGFQNTNPMDKEACWNWTGWSLLEWKQIESIQYNEILLKENGVPAVAKFTRRTTCGVDSTFGMFNCTPKSSLWHCEQLAHSLDSKVFETTTSNKQIVCKLHSILKDYTPQNLNNKNQSINMNTGLMTDKVPSNTGLNNKIEIVITTISCPGGITETLINNDKNDLVNCFILFLIVMTVVVMLVNALC